MKLTGIFQVLATAGLSASRSFYETHFGMHAVFVAEWYVHLVHREQPMLQLGLVEAGNANMPARDQRPNASSLVSLQVDDVDAVHRALRASNARLLDEPRDEPWGQRHFFAIDPGGFFVDVVTPIAPAAEYAASYRKP